MKCTNTEKEKFSNTDKYGGDSKKKGEVPVLNALKTERENVKTIKIFRGENK
jgi:hypothetical protein